MTELYIDGIAVILPKDFNVQVKRENPFITKNGEYSYDITLSLTNAVNAELYKHIHRLNSIQEIKSKRTAILVADNRVYCNGTEIITGWTENTVSIQVASGNSELNYFIEDDLLISSLEMKESTVVAGDQEHILKYYPEVDYCLVPVVNRSVGCVNQWDMKYKTESWSPELLASGNQWSPQPYLCAYIKDLLRVIGYQLTVNQLEDTPWKSLYICHVKKTCKWNEMIPGWSVKEFLEEIENLFNVVFVVDNRKRTVRLMLQGSYYAGTTSMHLNRVEDIYEVEIAEEPDVLKHSRNNVKYNLPENTYFRWRCILPSLMDTIKKDTIPADYIPKKYERIREWFMNDVHKKSNTIYTDLLDNTQYLYKWDRENFGNWPIFTMLNEFHSLVRDDSENIIELDIVPVELGEYGIEIYNMHGSHANTSKTILPIIDGGVQAEEGEGTTSLIDKIENGVQVDSELKEKIFLAFYTGLNDHKESGGLKFKYPLSYTDMYRPSAYLNELSEYYQTNSVGATLRLSAMDAFFYQNKYDIDFTKGVKIHTYDPNVYDPRLIFEARNKRYICKDMEFTLDAYGRKGGWTGTFYPIRISDTEADARWILTDGKWRDGGVWLDNGRWLDG